MSVPGAPATPRTTSNSCTGPQVPPTGEDIDRAAAMIRRDFPDLDLIQQSRPRRLCWWDSFSLRQVSARCAESGWSVQVTTASGLVMITAPGECAGSVALRRRLSPAAAVLAVLRTGRLTDPSQLLLTWSVPDQGELSAAEELAARLVLDHDLGCTAEAAVYLHEITDVIDTFGGSAALLELAGLALS